MEQHSEGWHGVIRVLVALVVLLPQSEKDLFTSISALLFVGGGIGLRFLSSKFSRQLRRKQEIYFPAVDLLPLSTVHTDCLHSH